MVGPRRVGILGLVAACIGALAVVVLAGTSPTAAHAASRAGASGGARRSARRPVVTPFGHAKPSGAKPYLGRAGTASPWTPLATAPSFSPGTMLLESDGTVLVHDEPASGATTQWWRLTPNSKGSYIDGTWSQIAAMPTGYAPLYFASAILPDG